jgi:hypothetical protein
MPWKKLSQASFLTRLRRPEVSLDGILEEESPNSIDSRDLQANIVLIMLTFLQEARRTNLMSTLLASNNFVDRVG